MCIRDSLGTNEILRKTGNKTLTDRYRENVRTKFIGSMLGENKPRWLGRRILRECVKKG